MSLECGALGLQEELLDPVDVPAPDATELGLGEGEELEGWEGGDLVGLSVKVGGALVDVAEGDVGVGGTPRGRYLLLEDGLDRLARSTPGGWWSGGEVGRRLGHLMAI